MEDLGALVSFLRVPILERPPTFRKYITNPITAKGSYENLKTLLRAICVRRTRDLLDLPEPLVQIRRIAFTGLERAEYESLLQECRTQIDMVVSGYVKRTMNSTVLESLLRLRIFCNNGGSNALLTIGANGLPTDPDEALTYLQQLDQNLCVHCGAIVYSIQESTETDGGRVMPSCKHLICHVCLANDAVDVEACPICASGNEGNCADSVPSNGLMTHTGRKDQHCCLPGQYPSKLQALVSDLRKDHTHKRQAFVPVLSQGI